LEWLSRALGPNGFNINTPRPNNVPGTRLQTPAIRNQIFNPKTRARSSTSKIGDRLAEARGRVPRSGVMVNGAHGELPKNWRIEEELGVTFQAWTSSSLHHSTNIEPRPNQGHGGTNGSAYLYNGGGVYCGPGAPRCVGGIAKTQYEPCSPTK